MTAHLVQVHPDGTKETAYPLHSAEMILGRALGGMWSQDPYLSLKHVKITNLFNGLWEIVDANSFNGTFLRITQSESLDDGIRIRMGKQLMSFHKSNPSFPSTFKKTDESPQECWGRLVWLLGPALEGSAIPLYKNCIRLGRVKGDIVCTQDEYMSATHAQITRQEGQILLQDSGSRNGTFLQIRTPRTVPSGTILLLGQRVFRLEA